MSDNKRAPVLPSLSQIRSEFEALCIERPDPVRILAAINQLQTDLDGALDAFISEDKVEGQNLSLWALHRFLVELGINTRLRAPLRSVIADLADTDRKGAEKPLPDLSESVLAAAALDTLVKARAGAQSAAKRIADFAGGNISADRLITFRENLQRGRARPEAIKMYRDMLRSVQEQWKHLDDEGRIREALLSVYGNIVPAKKP